MQLDKSKLPPVWAIQVYHGAQMRQEIGVHLTRWGLSKGLPGPP